MTPKISYCSGKFLYEEWPDEPYYLPEEHISLDAFNSLAGAFGNTGFKDIDEVHEFQKKQYELAKQSAIKAGVEFPDFDEVKMYLWIVCRENRKNKGTYKHWTPQDGQSWDCPDGVEISWEYRPYITWVPCTEKIATESNYPSRQVALLPKPEKPMKPCPNSMCEGTACSEGADCTCVKSQLRADLTEKKEEWKIAKHPHGVGWGWILTNGRQELYDGRASYGFLESIADRLNTLSPTTGNEEQEAMTADKLREKHKNEWTSFQTACEHKDISDWVTEYWMPAHGTGNEVRYCRICEKTIDTRIARWKPGGE